MIQRFLMRSHSDLSIAEDRSLPILAQNVPRPYERPGHWPAMRDIGRLPSVAGVVSGPQRTVHPQRRNPFRQQSQLGSSWNFPPFTRLWPQGRPGGVINQILNERPSPVRDRLMMMW